MKVGGNKSGPHLPFSPGRAPLEKGTPPAEPHDSFEPSVAPEAYRIMGRETLSEAELSFVQNTVEKAVSFFRTHFGQVKRPVTLNLGEGDQVLRTGFNIETDTINFPPDTEGNRGDLQSADIITHEVFHALIYQSYPELCSKERITRQEYVRLHEGLADYFTAKLYPDGKFAEDRGGHEKALRRYRNGRRVSLSPGGHSQGNAITSYLLKHDIQPSQVRSFLSGGDFSLPALASLSPELKADIELDSSFVLKDRVFNYPPSRLHRYRLEAGKPLRVEFTPNESLERSHPAIQIEWVRPSGIPSKTFVFRPDGKRSFSVEARQLAGAEKILALFKDGEEIIGSRPFYLGTAD